MGNYIKGDINVYKISCNSIFYNLTIEKRGDTNYRDLSNIINGVVFPLDSTLIKNARYGINTILKEKIKSKLVIPNPNSKLLFSKNSKFPRFELQSTNFKRVIKESNANYYVVNDDCGYIYTHVNMSTFKDDSDNLYLIHTCDLEQYSLTPESLIQKIKVWNNKNLTYVNKCDYGSCDFSDIDYFKVFFDPPKIPVTTDSILNEEVIKQFPSLTNSDLESIKSMLNSPDESIEELGFKMLCGYNFLERKALVKAIIYDALNNNRRINLKNYLSKVSTKNLFKCLNINFITPFPNWMYLLTDKENVKNISSEDIQEIKKIIIPPYKKLLDCNMTSLRRGANFPFIPKINITIE